MLVKKTGKLAVKVTDATGASWNTESAKNSTVSVVAEGGTVEVTENVGTQKERVILFVNPAAVVIDPA